MRFAHRSSNTLRTAIGAVVGTVLIATMTVGVVRPAGAAPCADPCFSIAPLAPGGEPEGNSTELDQTPNHVHFTVTRTGSPAQGATVDYATTSGTAIGGVDYTSATGQQAVFAPGAATATIEIPIVGDTIDESDETFTVTISNPLPSGNIGTASATGTILDDDAPPVFKVNDVTQTEGTGGTSMARFTITLVAGSSSATSGKTVTGTYATTNGTAIAPGDYTSTSGPVSFAPGETVKTVDVPIVTDSTDEDNETVTFTVAPTSDGTAGPCSHTSADCQATGTITDDDAPPTVTVANTSVQENAGPAVFTLTLSAASGKTVTVDYSLSAGTATSGADYTGPGSPKPVTFAPGATTGTVSVPIVDDSLKEGNETFSITLTPPAQSPLPPNGTTNVTIGAQGTATATIIDDAGDNDGIRVDDPSVAEGTGAGATMVFTITVPANANSLTVNYDVADGTATAPPDYIDESGSVTFAPADPRSKTVDVQLVGDAFPEQGETILLNISTTSGVPIADSQGVGTILNDDGPPPGFSIADNDTIAEGNSGVSSATFTVSLSGPNAQGASVDYATADGTATRASDYTPASGTLTWEPGDPISKSVTVQIIGDTTDEVNETFFVNLSNPTNASIADGQARGTIVDDDGPPSLSISDTTVTEGNSGTTVADFTITLAPASAETVTVSYATATGTATSGADYQPVPATTVTFLPGETTKPATVQVVGDTTDEEDQTFFVNLLSPSNATVVDGQGLGTIRDDDAAPTVSAANAEFTEGNSGTSEAPFAITLSAASEKAITVNYSTSNGTATAGSDYQAVASTPLSFAPGDVTKPVSVTIIGDTTDEPDETFNVNLSSPTNATLGHNPGVGTIKDDDGTPSLTINDVSVTEGNSGTKVAMFTVQLLPASASTVTVNYLTANDTATTPADYVAAANQLSFAAGETSKQVPVTIVGETTNEIDETYFVNLSGPTGGAVIADSQGAGTIVNDDFPTVSIADASSAEGTSGTTDFVFTVTLSAASAQTVTVDYATADVSAVAPGDYAAQSGTVSFAPGQTTQPITVQVVADQILESDETFTVTLSNAARTTIARSQATGTILNDDGTPSLSVGDASVNEGNSGTTTASFTVTMAGGRTSDVTVGYSTTDRTASAPSDYTATSGTLTFASGETTKTVNVPVVGDTAVESNESFSLFLVNPNGATIARAEGIGTIVNDDTAAGSGGGGGSGGSGGSGGGGSGSSSQGYSLVGEDGSLYAFGTAKNVGDMKGKPLNAPIIGVAYTPGGNGYWLVAKDGGIFTFGNAEFFGSMGDKKLNSPIIGMAATPTGKGYWLFAGDGGIFTFGDAEFFGSMGDKKLNAPVINMEPLESGKGYWLVAGDGGIFTFGQAQFFGSMGDKKLNQPVFDMTSTDTDNGYWLVARDGGIFSFGDAEPKFYGSAVNEIPRPTKVIGMDSTPGSLGYWIADASGKVYEYGNAQDLGDRYFSINPAPMISFASVPGVKP